MYLSKWTVPRNRKPIPSTAGKEVWSLYISKEGVEGSRGWELFQRAVREQTPPPAPNTNNTTNSNSTRLSSASSDVTRLPLHWAEKTQSLYIYAWASAKIEKSKKKNPCYGLAWHLLSVYQHWCFTQSELLYLKPFQPWLLLLQAPRLWSAMIHASIDAQVALTSL